MRVNVLKALALFFPLFNLYSFSYSSKEEYEVYLLKKAEELKLWEDIYWHKLLYYRKSFIKGYKSQNIKTDFFLSKYGRYSPKSELLRHVNSFFYDVDDDKSPECKFPLRYKWLRKKLEVDPLIIPVKECKEFKEWKKILNPSSVSIVFASGYLSNPSTLYGHTFLILRNPENFISPILDYTINYAASTDDKIGLSYAFKGIFGFYPGKFSTLPYYMKIQEYQNMESRDLWEYPLNLTNEEIDILLMHLWELGKAEFSYYFFSKNCSWQLLPLFDIIKDSTVSNLFSLWAIPTDTLKIIVYNFGDERKFIYRPSLYSKLKAKIENLNPQEEYASLKIISDIRNYEIFKSSFNEASRYKMLDTIVDYFSFLHYTGEISQKDMDIKMNSLLSEMNQITYKNQIDISNNQKYPPLFARNTMRLSIGNENRGGYFSYIFELRPALGELLDFNDGYSENSVLEMGRVDLRYINELQKFYVKNFTAVNVMSLIPMDRWFKKTSWSIKFGYAEHDLSDINHIKGNFYIQTLKGYSFQNKSLFSSIFYTLGGFSFNYITKGDNKFKPSLDFFCGFTGGKTKIKYDLNIELKGYKNERGFSQLNLGVSFGISKNISTVIKYSKSNVDESTSMLLNFFIFPL
ncbi:MAG: DUF4105 domain-containing protein [Elusimicrobiales bacterium]|nr:DUF4105 domain-containing protein [Elusimicrobiales bacterium]